MKGAPKAKSCSVWAETAEQNKYSQNTAAAAEAPSRPNAQSHPYRHMPTAAQSPQSLPSFPSFEGELKTDVLVIGGGLAGLLCTYRLMKAGVSCVLVEAERLCGGVTENTTAKLTYQHGLIYDKLINRFGIEAAKLYLEINKCALECYRRLCTDPDFAPDACDFEEKPNFIYSLNGTAKLEKELRALERMGCSASFQTQLPLPFPVAGAVRFDGQAQFNPLKFANNIAREIKKDSRVRIYEYTPVRELVGTTAMTDRGQIIAEKLIVTTHFPFINKHGSYFLKLYQSRSYVAAYENAADLHGMYLDESGHGLSFRNYKNLLLIGGASARTGKKSDGWRGIEAFAKEHYPHASERYRWATQDCMSLDGVPYIGRYSANTPNMFVATGFNKWGMTSSMAAAMLLSYLITGRPMNADLSAEKLRSAAELFSPSRSILRPQLVVNGFEAAANLLIPTVRRCPHLGCALKWNPNERTWDCPCHGSRFDRSGRLLNNPSTGDIPPPKPKKLR